MYVADEVLCESACVLCRRSSSVMVVCMHQLCVGQISEKVVHILCGRGKFLQ